MPLYRQLYSGLRRAILSGQFLPNTKLPSTRFLSRQLGLSRNTVLNSFEQLIAEGYLAGRHGSGTYIAAAVPDDLMSVRPQPRHDDSSHIGEKRAMSQRGIKMLAEASRMPTPLVAVNGGKPRAFREGIPALDEFPRDVWGRLLTRTWRYSSYETLNYGGCPQLREAIAGYLGTARGVRCTADQIVVVAGSQHGINLVTKVLLDPGDPVWIEDPGYRGASGGFLGSGAQIIPVPVDKEGIQVSVGVARCAEARLAFVTPSHQFPLGVTTTLKRRLELLEWANQAKSWILEDDYDSEYRYTGRPLAALQGIDHENRVIYLGTFSKVMFPALRLGYLVVPPDLVDAFHAARKFSIQHPPLLEQIALANFITEGHFTRHIRRMRTLYCERQEALIQAARCELGGLLEVESEEVGMHLLGWLPDGMIDVSASRKAAAHGVDAAPLSAYKIESTPRNALLLGYAGINEGEIEEGVQRLARALLSK